MPTNQTDFPFPVNLPTLKSDPSIRKSRSEGSKLGTTPNENVMIFQIKKPIFANFENAKSIKLCFPTKSFFKAGSSPLLFSFFSFSVFRDKEIVAIEIRRGKKEDCPFVALLLRSKITGSSSKNLRLQRKKRGNNCGEKLDQKNMWYRHFDLILPL